ncbi:MAG: TerB family tellurite resistance protein [Deltaproteobacteria bacterium]|jgi:tellurite resistance protein|nr:TerB family tellurite resistance protein [Deltaproteobacteria bacterium]
MPERQNQLLLYHTMMLMVTADGNATEEELSLVEVFCRTVPELRNADLKELGSRWREFSDGYDDRWDALSGLVDLEDERLSKKAFVLACDIALASEGIKGEEYDMLNDMAAALGVGDNEALGILNILRLKYV